MNLKKVLSVGLMMMLFLVISACGSDEGSGEAVELDLKEVQAFIDDKKSGFLYVKSPFDSEEENNQKLREIESVAKAEKIDFYVFDGNELPKSDFYEQNTSKKTLKQYTGTFAYYQDGEMKKELDFKDISEDDVFSEVEKFIKNVKEDYLK